MVILMLKAIKDTITSEAPVFKCKDSKFEFDSQQKSAAAIEFNANGTSKIINVTFYQVNNGEKINNNLDYKSHVIYISESSTRLEISDCLFDLCGAVDRKCAIFDNGKYTIINNCNFSNTKYNTKTIGAVHINSTGTHIITNCFSQYGCTDTGIFKYLPIEETEEEKSFTFINNTIDACIGNYGNGDNKIALNFEFKSSDQINIENITIQNILFSGGSIVDITLDDDINEFTLNSFKFINNELSSNDIGGSFLLIQNQQPNALIKFENCVFEGNNAKTFSQSFSGNGGAFTIGSKTDVMQIELKITNCTFNSNIAQKKGGALCLLTNCSLVIDECQFIGNKATENGGAIYVELTIESNSPFFQISKCKFHNNEGIDGHAIYLTGDDNESIINITNNEFINNFDETFNNHNSSIIITSSCSILYKDLIDDNNFKKNLESVNILSNKCENGPSQAFTNTKIITTQIPRKITFSKSFSLTYLNQKSVSFSLSFVSSNTFELSYDFNEGTYIMVMSQTYYQSYFPYIIYYLSPLYVEQEIIFNITTKRRISPEQLIGISCGSASVFFLVLGIVIFAIRRHNELRNQYNDADEFSYSSSEAEVKTNIEETNQIDSIEYQNNTEDFNSNSYDFRNFLP